MRKPHIKILVLPGGALPERKSKGAAGYDVRIRALIHPSRMDENDPRLRATLFDFEHMPADKKVAPHVREVPRYAYPFEKLPGLVQKLLHVLLSFFLSRCGRCLDCQSRELVYILHPGEVVIAGIGFITDTHSLSYEVRSRSGLAIKDGVIVEGDSIEMVTVVDPDYRGEAGVRIYNCGKKSIPLRRGMRIAQIVFQKPVFPVFDVVEDSAGISPTERGAKGFGSTGLV